MGASYLIRRACAFALAMGAAASVAAQAPATAPPSLAQSASFNIKPQPVAAALSAFALQTHQQILFTPEVVKGKTTQGVTGSLSVEAALQQLLVGTGLAYNRSADGMILVVKAGGQEAPAVAGPPLPPAGGLASPSVPPPASQEASGALEEVIVTASGRKQNIQDVPYNISAVSGESLQAAGVTDYYALAKSVPGLAVADTGPRGGLASSLVIRGISINAGTAPIFPDSTQPPVSTYIDSTPIFANLRITDLDRVEVLRGPQGTLYGANSSGGTIRFIYNQPVLQQLSAKVAAETARTNGASGLDYKADLTLNIPIAEQFALRVNAGQERNAGFIAAPRRLRLDQAGMPLLATPGDPVNSPPVFAAAAATNWDRTTSARIAGRWQPNDVFDARLSYQYQVQDSGGPQLVSYQAFGLDSLQTSSQIREPFHSTVHFAALETETHLGFATLTTSSSHFQTRAEATNDFTGFYHSFDFYASVYGNSPRFLAQGSDANNNRGFVQEVRLASDTLGPLKWVAGAFYERRHTVTRNQQYVPGYSDYFAACVADPTGSRPCGFGTFYPDIPSFADGRVLNSKDFSYLNNTDQVFSDAALYTELEFSITDRFRLTGGLRGYHQSTTNDEVGGLLFLGPIGVGGATRNQSGHGVLGKAGVSYELTRATMLYTLFSQGIRPAGINGLPDKTYDFSGAATVTPGTLFDYKADRINNFEAGIKGTLRSRLDYTLTYFDMRWNDVQQGTSVTALQIGAVINAGDARSRGVELEVSGPITQHLRASLGYTYVDAKLTSVRPPIGVSPDSYSVGAPLPGVPDQMASLGLQYTQPLWGDATLTYAMNASYRGRSSSALLITQDTPAGGFWTFDPSVTLGNGPWSVRLYARNVSDKLGVYGYTARNWGDWAGASISRPRTVGLSAQYNWH